jgi:serine/threonine-protein kinase
MTFTLEPGAIVAGRYRLDRLLGRGGMGEVWAAEQTITRKKVAVKFLAGAAALSDETRRRFIREARAACAVQHPNVVEVHDVVEADADTPAMVMELLRGESLEAKLQRDGKLALEEALSIVLRVVSAVGTAHTLGIIHRDIKPDNIFIAETPEGTEVKVLDFGIAKIATNDDGEQTANLTATGSMLGTPYYMSPEQAFGEKRIDHRADIWSIGIVLYRCLSGQLPTQADNLGQILKVIMTRSIPKLGAVAPELPKPISALVDRMLGYSPSERPADLREVKAAIESFLRVRVSDFGAPAIDASSLGGVTSPVVPAPPAEAPPPIRRKLPSGAFALGGALLFGVVTLGIVLSGRGVGPVAVPTGRETAGSVVLSAPVLPSEPPSGAVAVTAAAPSGGPVVTPSASSPAPAARTGKLPQPGAPATAQAVTATAAPTSAPSSGWGGIVDKPGF